MAEYKPCRQCGKPVKFYPYDLRHNRKKFCSKECNNIANKGKHLNPRTEFKKGFTYWKGKKRPEIKQWLTPFKKGNVPHNKGKPWDLETRLKLSKARKGKNMGESNHAWKGDKVGYTALHDYIKDRLIKPKNCPKCGSDKFIQLSNVSGEYKRELSDWQWLCAKCHYEYDRKRRFKKKSPTNI